MKEQIIDTPLIRDPGPGQVGADVVALANASRFESRFLNKPLQEYVVGGWDRDPLMELLEAFFPAVQVADRFHYKEETWAEFFLRMETDGDRRAMGGRFGRLEPSRREEINDRLDEKGLTILVDRRDLDEDPMAQEQATDRLRRILLRTELRRAIALVIAASVNTNVVWSTTADPDQDVADELLDVEDSVGLRPNRAIYGSQAWSHRSRSIRGNTNADPGARASASWTPEQLGDFLGVSAVSVTEARYRESVTDLATMIGNLVFMLQTQAGLSKDDPSNTKRFVGNIAGQRQAVWVQEFPHGNEVTVAWKSKPKITSAIGMRHFTTSTS